MPNPILKVLSTLKNHRVEWLLMGGQACVFYGAAEFSRDTDVALLASPENLDRLVKAMADLAAEVIDVPPLELDYLKRGHAVHFRCHHPEADGMRLDVMSTMRGLPDFEILWNRRTTVRLENREEIDLLSLPDLVQAKKTQRDKDWPMIRRLIEAHYVQFSGEPNADRIQFWLTELRTPALLRKVVALDPGAVGKAAVKRPFLTGLAAMTDQQVEEALQAEEKAEREADRLYWMPLRTELEQIRHGRFT